MSAHTAPKAAVSTHTAHEAVLSAHVPAEAAVSTHVPPEAAVSHSSRSGGVRSQSSRNSFNFTPHTCHSSHIPSCSPLPWTIYTPHSRPSVWLDYSHLSMHIYVYVLLCSCDRVCSSFCARDTSNALPSVVSRF